VQPIELLEGAHEVVFTNPGLGKREQRRVQIRDGRDESVKIFWE
jgi:hypothetical protein